MNLIELREVFRARMREEDFCIDEAQVEKLFRELLGEPEPEKQVFAPIGHVSLQQTIDALNSVLDEKKLTNTFEADSLLYDKLKKR